MNNGQGGQDDKLNAISLTLICCQQIWLNIWTDGGYIKYNLWETGYDRTNIRILAQSAESQ